MRYHRLFTLAFCLLGCVAAALPASALAVSVAHEKLQGSSMMQMETLDSSIFGELNAIRVAHGLAPLALSPQLANSAAAHTSEMLERGYFAHPSFDGQAFWQRIQQFYPSAGTASWTVGENLEWSAGQTTASASVAAWMASPPHRANILDPTFRQIGIAAESESDAPGVYAGLTVTVITTDFGRR